MAVRVQVGGYKDGEQPVFETSYVGCVLETRERNYYDDSDFYAIVWDEPTQAIKTVDYGSTRYWSYNNGAAVDATSEVLAKARAYQAQALFQQWKAHNEVRARLPEMGRVVHVVAGRKVPVGTVGTVVWEGAGKKFSPSRWEKPQMRVGIQLEDGRRVFTAATNCEAVNPVQYLQSEEEGRRLCERQAQGSFATLVALPGMAVL